MSFLLKNWKQLALVLLTSIIAQCNKEDSETKNFKVDLVSSSPLIRVVDRTIGSMTVEANWFDLTMRFTNSTSYKVRIEDILFYVSVDGVEKEPISFDLGQLQVVNTDDEIITFVNYCNYPNDSTIRTLSACNTADLDADTASPPVLYPLVYPVTLYLGGIEDSVDSPQNRAFPVRMVLYGIFIDTDGTEVERFEKTVYFTTQ